MTIVITRKVTFSPLVWLLPCVNEGMSLQIATPVERFVGFSCARKYVFFKVIMIIARIGTLRALVWLLHYMNERMFLQIVTQAERFVALITNIFFYSSMGSLVTSKA